MKIKIVELGGKWSLMADLQGSHNHGEFWSMNRTWTANQSLMMAFPTKDMAVSYLTINRRRMTTAPMLP